MLTKSVNMVFTYRIFYIHIIQSLLPKGRFQRDSIGDGYSSRRQRWCGRKGEKRDTGGGWKTHQGLHPSSWVLVAEPPPPVMEVVPREMMVIWQTQVVETERSSPRNEFPMSSCSPGHTDEDWVNNVKYWLRSNSYSVGVALLVLGTQSFFRQHQ